MTLEYNDFRYIIESNTDFIGGMNITYKDSIPNFSYKYFTYQNHNLESIINGELYFSHPYRFNDITDSTVHSFDFSQISFVDYSRFFSDTQLTKKKLEELFENDKLTNFELYRSMFYSMWTQKIGILCLTTNEMHNLMWGHYSSDSGFMVKFKTNDLLGSFEKMNEYPPKIFPINYVDSKVQVDTIKYGLGLPLLLDFSTKVKSWSYENEWRIVMTKNDMDVPVELRTPNIPSHNGKDSRLFKFEHDCIEEIVLGMHFLNGMNLQKSEIKSNTIIHITTKSDSLDTFLDCLIENFSSQIYQAGIYRENIPVYENAYPIGRSTERIEIKKIGDGTYQIERVDPKSIKKF